MKTDMRTIILATDTPRISWRSRQIRYVEDAEGVAYVSLADLKYAGAYSTSEKRLGVIWETPDVIRVKPAMSRTFMMVGLGQLEDHMCKSPAHAAERKAMTREICALILDDVAERIARAKVAEHEQRLEDARRAQVVADAQRESGIPLDASRAADISDVRTDMSLFDDELADLDRRVRELERRAEVVEPEPEPESVFDEAVTARGARVLGMLAEAMCGRLLGTDTLVSSCDGRITATFYGPGVSPGPMIEVTWSEKGTEIVRFGGVIVRSPSLKDGAHAEMVWSFDKAIDRLEAFSAKRMEADRG